MDSGIRRLRILLFSYATVATLFELAFLTFSRISVDFASFRLVISMVVVLPLAAAIFRRRGRVSVPLVLDALGLCLWISMLGLVSSYLSIAQSKPLADEFLLSLDRILGFDGPALVLMVDRLPFMAFLLGLAYSSFGLQLMLLPVLLIVVGRPHAGLRLILTFALTTSTAAFISIWFPAVGSMVTYGFQPDTLQSIDAYYGYAFLDQFSALRKSWDISLSLDHAQGILTFPSVHAAAAFLCAGYALAHPSLRFPVLALNVLMAFSTLTHGGHYLVDVIAGCMIALFSMGIVHLLEVHSDRAITLFSICPVSTLRTAWCQIVKDQQSRG